MSSWVQSLQSRTSLCCLPILDFFGNLSLGIIVVVFFSGAAPQMQVVVRGKPFWLVSDLCVRPIKYEGLRE